MIRNGLLKALASLLLMIPGIVNADQYGDFTYSMNGTNVTITGYTGSGGAVIIPGTISNMTVTDIGNRAFAKCTNLTSVTIPDSVTSIASSSRLMPGAFFDCSSLTNVLMSANLKSIGSSAFAGCTSLTSVTIPDSVTNLGENAFDTCSDLTNVIFGTSVTSIEGYAFHYCSSLTTVVIPKGVANIGKFAFLCCSSLTNVIIGSGVTNIEVSAFWFSKLKTITVDANNPTYSSLDGALFNKSQTTLLQCPNGAASCYTIPSGVTNIGDAAFAFCADLTNITIPCSVTSIGNDAFDECASLTTITIPCSVARLGEYAFEFCTSLSSITIGNDIATIGDGAFWECTSLANVFFCSNAPGFGSSVFYDDYVATVYYMPSTTGWQDVAVQIGVPIVLWNPQPRTSDGDFGVRSNQFGFDIGGTANIPVMLETATNLTGGPWRVLQSFTLTNGSVYFSDPDWTNYPSRFYRIRSP